MDNLFDSDNYPEQEPAELFAGSRWAWKRPDITSTYATATYTLSYRFSLQEDPFTDRNITASKVSSEHIVEVAKADTTGWTAGEYKWQAIVTRDSDSEEVVVSSGFITIRHDFDDEAGDTRSWVYITLLNIRAVLQSTASKEQASYSVAGRSLSRRTPEELLELEREFARRWDAEKAAEDRKNGRKGKSNTLVKMRA